jgi:hypothetical protein
MRISAELPNNGKRGAKHVSDPRQCWKSEVEKAADKKRVEVRAKAKAELVFCK